MAWKKVSARSYMDSSHPQTSILQKKRPDKGYTVFHGGYIVRDFKTLAEAKRWVEANVKPIRSTRHQRSVKAYARSYKRGGK